jgi:hypothetical protein
VLGLFGTLFQTFCAAAVRSLNVAPTVPPASDGGELEDLASEDLALDAAENPNATREWASAMLFGRRFEMPGGTIGGWLSQLDIRDAERIARADGARMLDRHLSGRGLVHGLPPVNDATATKRWCERNRPVSCQRLREASRPWRMPSLNRKTWTSTSSRERRKPLPHSGARRVRRWSPTPTRRDAGIPRSARGRCGR